MSFDPWGAWQAAAALWAPPGAMPGAGFAPGAGSAGGASGAAAFAQLAERFQAATRTFLASAAAGAPGAAGSGAGAAEDFTRFLREQFAPLRMPWSFDARGFGAGAASAGAAGAGGAGAPGWAIGAGREHQERLARLSAAWTRVLEAQRRLELLWSDALREAASTYTQQVAAAPPQEPSAESLQGLYDRWIDCAEDAYGRMAHSETYCDAFAEYVNAGSQWRNELQAGLEQWAKLLDLPTRSELNTLEQRVRELERAQRIAPTQVSGSAREPVAARAARRAPRRPRRGADS